MSVPPQRFPFAGAASPGGKWPPILGVPLDEPSGGPDPAAATNLNYVETFLTTDESITASIADVSGATIDLARGTWLILAHGTFFGDLDADNEDGFNLLLTDSSNNILASGSHAIAMGSSIGSAPMWATISLSCIVVQTNDVAQTYKLRANVFDGTGLSGEIVSDGNESDPTTDKATSLRAIKIAPA